MDEGRGCGGRVSRVLFVTVISLGPLRDRPPRRLGGCSRLSASASNLITAGSEIAAGRIALFTRGRPTSTVAPRFGLCCSHTENRVPIWTVDARRRLPGFHRAPSLDAAQTFLWPWASDHPSSLPLTFQRTGSLPDGPGTNGSAALVDDVRHAMTGCRRGDLNSHGLLPTTP